MRWMYLSMQKVSCAQHSERVNGESDKEFLETLRPKRFVYLFRTMFSPLGSSASESRSTVKMRVGTLAPWNLTRSTGRKQRAKETWQARTSASLMRMISAYCLVAASRLDANVTSDER